jgi:hypothetical protein
MDYLVIVYLRPLSVCSIERMLGIIPVPPPPPQYVIMIWHLIKHRVNLTFTSYF